MTHSDKSERELRNRAVRAYFELMEVSCPIDRPDEDADFSVDHRVCGEILTLSKP